MKTLEPPCYLSTNGDCYFKHCSRCSGDKVPNSPYILIVIKIADPGRVRVGPQHIHKRCNTQGGQGSHPITNLNNRVVHGPGSPTLVGSANAYFQLIHPSRHFSISTNFDIGIDNAKIETRAIIIPFI